MTHTDTPIFYSLPARLLAEGMSTDDGQDVMDVVRDNDCVVASVYTPRSDDPIQDEINRSEPESRIYTSDALVDLAVFADTQVDGRRWAIPNTDQGANS